MQTLFQSNKTICWNELTTYLGETGLKPLAGVVNQHPLYPGEYLNLLGIFKQLRI